MKNFERPRTAMKDYQRPWKIANDWQWFPKTQKLKWLQKTVNNIQRPVTTIWKPGLTIYFIYLFKILKTFTKIEEIWLSRKGKIFNGYLQTNIGQKLKQNQTSKSKIW